MSNAMPWHSAVPSKVMDKAKKLMIQPVSHEDLMPKSKKVIIG